MNMRYLSVCSGIEAASVAWHPLGWRPFAFSEIEAFPSAVLAHHYQDTPNFGDMTRFKDWPDAAFDVLVGGTPCQSFSVAGLRKGLDDPRGSLMLVYLAIAHRYSPKWLVWENVPGVLSSDDGRAFGSLLGGLAILGYGFAYRILDAQYFGLAQRRQRVFVVGRLGDWRRAAAVLFERESLSGHPAPRREAGQDVTGTLSSRASAGGGLGTDFDIAGGVVPALSACGGTEKKHGHGWGQQELANGYAIPVASTLAAKDGRGVHSDMSTFVARSLRADGFDASEDGTGRGTPLIAFSVKDHGADASELAPTLRAGGHDRSHANGGVMPAIAGPVMSTYGKTLSRAGKEGGRIDNHAIQNTQVRRLTPRECERLQGFPDDYTLIPYHGNPAKDGPRYKALGNSMAVPCMAWIGRRIEMVDALEATT